MILSSQLVCYWTHNYQALPQGMIAGKCHVSKYLGLVRSCHHRNWLKMFLCLIRRRLWGVLSFLRKSLENNYMFNSAPLVLGALFYRGCPSVERMVELLPVLTPVFCSLQHAGRACLLWPGECGYGAQRGEWAPPLDPPPVYGVLFSGV